MMTTNDDLLLVTGATGLVGSHVIDRAAKIGMRTRALVRSNANTGRLEKLGVERVMGDMSDALSLHRAVDGASIIVHCAAKVGDWGDTEDYRKVNVEGLDNLLTAAADSGSLRRFIHISSLGVYEARDHFGTDETEEPHAEGIDGYTLTKIEAEQLLRRAMRKRNLPAVILRPGFIYGSRDRTVVPRLLERLETGKFAFLGTTEKLMNNTYVENLVDAIFLAINKDGVDGEIFNIRDGRLVSKLEFMQTMAEAAGFAVPSKVVPEQVARKLAWMLESLWNLFGVRSAPILNSARIKFLALNLDFSIDKARQRLGYDPAVDFTEAMQKTVAWHQKRRAD